MWVCSHTGPLCPPGIIQVPRIFALKDPVQGAGAPKVAGNSSCFRFFLPFTFWGPQPKKVLHPVPHKPRKHAPTRKRFMFSFSPLHPVEARAPGPKPCGSPPKPTLQPEVPPRCPPMCATRERGQPLETGQNGPETA